MHTTHLGGGALLVSLRTERLHKSFGIFCREDLSLFSHLFIYSIICSYQHGLMDIYSVQSYFIYLVNLCIEQGSCFGIMSRSAQSSKRAAQPSTPACFCSHGDHISGTSFIGHVGAGVPPGRMGAWVWVGRLCPTHTPNGMFGVVVCTQPSVRTRGTTQTI